MAGRCYVLSSMKQRRPNRPFQTTSEAHAREGWRWCTKFLSIQLSIILLAGCSDSVTERYATIEDARKAGLFQRGWLPDALPSSARNIEARNDLDLNVSAGKFVVARGDVDSFAARLQPHSAEASDADVHLASYLQVKEKEGLRVGVLKQAASVWAFICDSRTGHCTYQLTSRR